MPWYDAQVGDWSAALHQIVTMQVPHLWVHFLYLYAIYLLLSVPAVWLLRKRQPWIIVCLSVIGYIYGTTADIEWLRWQIIFFVPVIIGFYLPVIQRWWANTSRKMQFTIATYSTAIITVIISVLYVTYQNALPASATVNDIFDIYDFSPARIAVAAVWFTALVLLFNKITPWLAKHTYGVIHYFGTHSLTAYIAHGVVLCAIAILVPIKDNFFINTAAGLAAILGVYLLIRIPVVRRLLPR